MTFVKQALIAELQRLKDSGHKSVFLSDATLSTLEQANRSHRATPPANESTARVDKINIETPVEVAPKKPHKVKASTNLPEDYAPIPSPPDEFKIPEGDQNTQLEWLRETVHSCPTCQAHLSRQGKIVFGSGAPDADIFFCGEAPGADEEASGEPFVGKAGELLDKIIAAMGLQRDAVYIGNILKWRPEHNKPYGNRPPTKEEMDFCLPYLRAQLKIIAPKVIIALGNTAVSGLLGPDPSRRMGSVRGTWETFEGTPVMITFHPSYLLRNATLKTKRMAWEDMLQVMEKVGLPISERQKGYFLK